MSQGDGPKHEAAEGDSSLHVCKATCLGTGGMSQGSVTKHGGAKGTGVPKATQSLHVVRHCAWARVVPKAKGVVHRHRVVEGKKGCQRHKGAVAVARCFGKWDGLGLVLASAMVETREHITLPERILCRSARVPCISWLGV
ncbi:Hypothetical predicted protein [Prunus dulcis]|uniref:Uncharacterized protein n=1 Tax=Prunus dulcis TaxID=3755 RepID=A0A5E4GEM8_PRUDU|nr:Hypothetical predicted protein [Prunus dulcis]